MLNGQGLSRGHSVLSLCLLWQHSQAILILSFLSWLR